MRVHAILMCQDPLSLSLSLFLSPSTDDVTRVHLLDGPVDYINANYVNVRTHSLTSIIL